MNKDHPNVIALPPVIVLAFLIASVIMQWIFPLPYFLPLVMKWFGFVLVFGGIGLVVWSARTLRAGETNVNPYKPVLKFIVAGPFEYLRNPIYLGFLSIFLGVCFFCRITWGFLFLLPLFLVLHFGVVLREEKYLKEKFPKEFSEYAEKVGRWF